MNFFKNIFITIIHILLIYFSNLPYYIYSHANKNSNLALVGLGIGLLDAQKLFWISNFILLIKYNFVAFIPFFLNYIIFYFSIYLYLKSLLLCFKLIPLIK